MAEVLQDEGDEVQATVLTVLIAGRGRGPGVATEGDNAILCFRGVKKGDLGGWERQN